MLYKDINQRLGVYLEQLDSMISKQDNVYTKQEFDTDNAKLQKLKTDLIFTADGYLKEDRTLIKQRAVYQLISFLTLDNLGEVNDQLKVKSENQEIRQKYADNNAFVGTYGPLRDIDIARPGESLGVGSNGEVRSLFIKIPDGTVIEAGRKFDSQKASDAAFYAGIPDSKPEEAKRAVATYEASRFLGLDIVPPTFLIVGKNPKTNEDEIGYVMERVPGTDGQKKVRLDEVTNLDAIKNVLEYKRKFDEDPQSLSSQEMSSFQGYIIEVNDEGAAVVFVAIAKPVDIDYTQSVVQKGLADQQLLDNFVGHADRQASNWRYLMDINNKIIAVKTIDNDDAWGKDWAPRNGNLGSKTPGGPPPIVDVHSAISILKADAQNIPVNIKNKLTDEEVGLAVIRLQKLQAGIIKRIENGNIAKMPDTDLSEEDQEFLKAQTSLEDNFSFQNMKEWGVHDTYVAMAEKRDDESTKSYLGEMLAMKEGLGTAPVENK